MKIDGRIRKTSIEKVDVDVLEFLEELRRSLLIRPAEQQQGAYINRDGQWEVDYGGHGSGHQEQFRKATEAEVELGKAFALLMHTARRLPR